MKEILIQFIEQAALYAQTWGFLLIFVFMTIESSFIPFPSEVVMIPAGFLAARGGLSTGQPLLDLILAVLVGTAGSLSGALLNYYLARWLGMPFLQRFGRYFFLPPHHLDRASEVFRQYGVGATFFCRLLPGIRQLISIPAGLAGMPLASFSLWTSLGAGLWVGILTGAGYWIGTSSKELTYAELTHAGIDLVKHNFWWIAPAAAAGLVLYVLVSSRIMRRSTPG